jgi:hypothetical protein
MMLKEMWKVLRVSNPLPTLLGKLLMIELARDAV